MDTVAASDTVPDGHDDLEPVPTGYASMKPCDKRRTLIMNKIVANLLNPLDISNSYDTNPQSHVHGCIVIVARWLRNDITYAMFRKIMSTPGCISVEMFCCSTTGKPQSAEPYIGARNGYHAQQQVDDEHRPISPVTARAVVCIMSDANEREQAGTIIKCSDINHDIVHTSEVTSAGKKLDDYLEANRRSILALLNLE